MPGNRRKIIWANDLRQARTRSGHPNLSARAGRPPPRGRGHRVDAPIKSGHDGGVGGERPDLSGSESGQKCPPNKAARFGRRCLRSLSAPSIARASAPTQPSPILRTGEGSKSSWRPEMSAPRSGQIWPQLCPLASGQNCPAGQMFRLPGSGAGVRPHPNAPPSTFAKATADGEGSNSRTVADGIVRPTGARPKMSGGSKRPDLAATTGAGPNVRGHRPSGQKCPRLQVRWFDYRKGFCRTRPAKLALRAEQDGVP